MSTNKDTQKTLEVKIRPFQNSAIERADQKGLSRVHLSKEALFDLKLEAGQPCLLWKVGEDEGQKIEAIAWPTSEKSLGKKAAQMTRSFQEICGFKLSDELKISAGGSLQMMESVIVKDTTALDTLPELKAKEKPAWDWLLREFLFRADIIFVGMIFKDVSCRGFKRTFMIESINGAVTGQAKYQETSTFRIASAMDATTTPQVNDTKPKLQVVNVAGIDQALKKLNRFLSNFDRKFQLTLGTRSCSVLLHGGHGTGKTNVIDEIIATGWGRVHRIERSTKVSGIRNTFKDAILNQPSIIVLDDLEKMVSKEDSVSEDFAEALGKEMDNLVHGTSESLPRVLVIAATLNLGSIPISLRKRKRFSTDIVLPVPDATCRKAVLRSFSIPTHPDKRDDIVNRLGDRTHAYTAADLRLLVETACDTAEDKYEQRQTDPNGCKEDDSIASECVVTEEDIEEALLLVRPTAMHDVTLRPQTVRWNEIGGQESVKKALRRAVETPLLYPEEMKLLGATAKKGILLYGPPGCSKTLSAKAMATESGFNFFAVQGAELLNMYLGESERAIRDVFARARAASPSVIFFDEIESIGSKREVGKNSGVNTLTTLLNEMDGIETLKGVTVLAATNQPQNLDLALIRPGRFDELLYVPPPDYAGREAILRVKQRTMNMALDVDIPELARLTDGHSGAELVDICQVACDAVWERFYNGDKGLQITMADLLGAVKGAKRQITKKMIGQYEDWANAARGDIHEDTSESPSHRDSFTPDSQVGESFGHPLDPPRPAREGMEWVWFPEGYWAERVVI